MKNNRNKKRQAKNDRAKTAKLHKIQEKLMRDTFPAQRTLGEIDIADIKIDVRSRDDILLGLQHIYCTDGLREKSWIQLRSAILVFIRLLAMAQQKIPNKGFYCESFSRTMIELIHHCLNLVIGYVLKTAAFGKVLPDQAIGTTFKPRSQE